MAVDYLELSSDEVLHLWPSNPVNFVAAFRNTGFGQSMDSRTSVLGVIGLPDKTPHQRLEEIRKAIAEGNRADL